MKKIIELTPGIRVAKVSSTRSTLLRAAKAIKNCDKVIIVAIRSKVFEKEITIESHCYDNCDDFIQKIGILQSTIQNIGRE